MFDLWYDLPPILRALMGLGLIVLAVLCFFLFSGRIAIGLGAIGIVFLLFCKAGSNNGGYNF